VSPRAARLSPPTRAQPVEAPPAEDTAEAVVESVVEADNSEEVRATPPLRDRRPLLASHAPRSNTARCREFVD